MAATPPPTRRFRRKVALGIGAVFAILVAALVIYLHRFLQPERFTALLEKDLAAAGLKLDLDAPAEPRLFPRPGVQLQGFTLTNTGARIPVLQADGATIVVPWRALLRGDAAIEKVEIDAPRVDLGELESLLGRLPRRSGPPRLPDIATGVHMRDGTLTRNGSPLLFNFSLATGALAPGQTFRLDAAARTASGRNFAMDLSTVPGTGQDGAIEFGAVGISLAEQDGASLQLAGRGSWRGGEGLAMQLHGTLRHHTLEALASAATVAKAAEPATSGSTTTRADRYTEAKVTLDITPAANDAPLSVALQLTDETAHVDLRLYPTEVGNWWRQLLTADGGRPTAPMPVAGTVHAQQLDLGWLKATGLSIEAGPDVVPVAGTTGAPASAASAGH